MLKKKITALRSLIKQDSIFVNMICNKNLASMFPPTLDDFSLIISSIGKDTQNTKKNTQ